MASKVLVPTAPFAKLQVKKSPPESSGSGFIIGGSDAAARVAHLEHSVRFLQEQHRQMLSGLHAEIEALRERNRDLQFQLIFNKEATPKPTTPAQEECSESNEEANLKREVSRLEREAAAARSEARAAEARALQLQRLLDAQTEKLRELECRQCGACGCAGAAEAEREAALSPGAAESRAELRARLADAERLVRRLRADAERQRRELQCMKNSLHASLRASGLDGYGYQNNYHFPPVHTPEFWREPLRENSMVFAETLIWRGPGGEAPGGRSLCPSCRASKYIALPSMLIITHGPDRTDMHIRTRKHNRRAATPTRKPTTNQHTEHPMAPTAAQDALRLVATRPTTRNTRNTYTNTHTCLSQV